MSRKKKIVYEYPTWSGVFFVERNETFIDGYDVKFSGDGGELNIGGCLYKEVFDKQYKGDAKLFMEKKIAHRMKVCEKEIVRLMEIVDEYNSELSILKSYNGAF